MKIACKLNGKEHQFNTYSDKPLSLVLIEESPVTSLCPGCGRGSCGNCIVLIDNKPAVSCLVPAFSVREKEIVTFEGYSRSRFYTDIKKGYTAAGIIPCAFCYPSKTLIIESILRESTAPEADEILRALSINACTCVDHIDLVEAVQEAAKLRRRRRVRRS